MGSSSYVRKSYSGKGSSSYSTSSYTPSKKISYDSKTPMEYMLNLLEDVEQNRRNVNERKNDVTVAHNNLVKAEENLQRSERKVMMQLEQLDPETREILKRMMNGLNDRNFIH